MTPRAPDRRVVATFGERIRATSWRSPGVESAVKNGSPCMPGSATAGTPSEATAATRSGASTARQSAHIPPSEVPTIGTRSRPSASSSEVSWATACARSGRPL